MMSLGDIVFTIAFALCAFIAVAGALGMTTTMSMFRSGIFLMASFIGVAGLFILLAADLMGLLQIMMYIGGMLVMVLFMILFMHDPGGAMMAGMTDMMSPVERLFSGGLQQEKKEGGEMAEQPADQDAGDGSAEHQGMDHRMQPGDAQGGEKALQHKGHQGEEDEGKGDQGKADSGMDMGGMDMSMVTPVRKLAAWLAAATGLGLALLVLFLPAWPVVAARPDPQSARAVGMLLMDKYMVAFEGAGFMILLGIFGAVFLARVERHPDQGERGEPVAHADDPPAIAADPVGPQHDDNAHDPDNVDHQAGGQHAHGGHA